MGLIQPEILSNQSFDPISFNCIACPFASRDPQSRNAQPIVFENQNEMARVMPPPRPI
jgi:hypothetical protein